MERELYAEELKDLYDHYIETMKDIFYFISVPQDHHGRHPGYHSVNTGLCGCDRFCIIDFNIASLISLSSSSRSRN